MNGESKGFTLVELVVTIAILGILAGIAIPRFFSATEAARGSKIIADMHTCEEAVNIFYAKNGVFPQDKTVLEGTYIAVWPLPPTGNAIINKNDNSELHVDVRASGYVYTKPISEAEIKMAVGRVTLGKKSITDLLTAKGNSLTLTD